ncbi:hypothetical protein CK203_011688 [Vitis vinifera]|uniref:KIB1-4 beta-propeller domain-containing protein n=1 Tax=Vitis vinifera TaxID=29760 RepID=A0A438JUP6_VITVI|nr:hypothetical protein CK203_011688 [Vitis vinifera]
MFEDASIPTDCFTSKVVASSSPLDPSCVVMVIHDTWNKLALGQPGDEEWKTLKSGICHYQDTIFYKGNFHAIAKLEGGIVQCNIGPEPKAIPFAPGVRAHPLENKYLVESCGELLQDGRDRTIWDGNIERFVRFFSPFLAELQPNPRLNMHKMGASLPRRLKKL